VFVFLNLLKNNLLVVWNLVNFYFSKLFSWRVRLGDYDLSNVDDDAVAVERDFIKIYVHPGYDDWKLYFDFALLKVDPIEFSFYVRPGNGSFKNYVTLGGGARGGGRGIRQSIIQTFFIFKILFLMLLEE
jgi:hypothetical protein